MNSSIPPGQIRRATYTAHDGKTTEVEIRNTEGTLSMRAPDSSWGPLPEHGNYKLLSSPVSSPTLGALTPPHAGRSIAEHSASVAFDNSKQVGASQVFDLGSISDSDAAKLQKAIAETRQEAMSILSEPDLPKTRKTALQGMEWVYKEIGDLIGDKAHCHLVVCGHPTEGLRGLAAVTIGFSGIPRQKYCEISNLASNPRGIAKLSSPGSGQELFLAVMAFAKSQSAQVIRARNVYDGAVPTYEKAWGFRQVGQSDTYERTID